MAIERSSSLFPLRTGDRLPSQGTTGDRLTVSYGIGVETGSGPNRGTTYVYRAGEPPPIGTISRLDGSGGPVFTPTVGVSLTEGEQEYFRGGLGGTNSRSVVVDQSIPFLRGQGRANQQINDTLGSNLSPGPTDATGPITATIADLEGVRSEYEHLFYPEAIRGNKQDVIRFTMKRYGARTIPGLEENGNLSQLATFGTRNFERIFGSVTLPIQAGITDSNNIEWGQSDLNAVNAYLASKSLSTIGSGGDFLQTLSSLGSSILKDITKVIEDESTRNAINVYIAQEAVGINNLLSRVSGGILNPNMELLFNGPQLRPFSFTFRLSPRSETEATQVRKIIRFFKQGMSVKRASSDIFLKAPHVFDVRYISYRQNGTEMEHPSIGRIKTCALTGFDVDYTPDGSYMTFNDPKRTMTSYQISMRFTELEPVTESTFNSNSRDTPFFDSSTASDTRFAPSPLGPDEIGY